MMFRRNGAAQLIVVWRCEISKSARVKKSEIGSFLPLNDPIVVFAGHENLRVDGNLSLGMFVAIKRPYPHLRIRP
jgi:hypothetical protein